MGSTHFRNHHWHGSSGTAGVVVAHNIVEIFPRMYGRRAVLPHHLFPFLVIRRRLRPGQIPDVQHNIPLERWTASGTALFGLQDRIRKTAAIGTRQVRAHMRIPHPPTA